MDARKCTSNSLRAKFKNQKGQALVEFMLFLPFMLMLYATISSIGNALNGSINQQKITRSYFYYRAQNNSMLPKPYQSNSDWKLYGMSINGWLENFSGGGTGDGGEPLAPCYKFDLPLGDTADDECEESYASNTTQYIRVGTVYGVCGTTYSNEDGGTVRLPGASSELVKVAIRVRCEI